MQRDRIAQPRALAEYGRDVPAVGLAAKGLDVEAFERQARKHDDAVIAFLSIERHVLVAETLEALERKPVVGTLGFLQTEHVGANRLHEPRDAVDAQPHRIDVPGRNRQSHQEN